MSHSRYYSNINKDLLNAIPKRLSRILEIGCGEGALGAEYKKANPNCVYCGVEIEPEPAAQAESSLDQVVCANISHLDLAEFGNKPFDCIIYGDVLEHLISPWDELKARVEWLGPKGVVLASIPNVQHWSILVKLLMGEWEYEDKGILDRTHLRFFTKSSLRALFQAAGLKVTRLKAVRKQTEWSDRVLESMMPTIRALKVDETQFLEQANAYQYLVKAFKAKE